MDSLASLNHSSTVVADPRIRLNEAEDLNCVTVDLALQSKLALTPHHYLLRWSLYFTVSLQQLLSQLCDHLHLLCVSLASFLNLYFGF